MMKMVYRHGTGKWMVRILHIMLCFLEPGQFMKVGYKWGKDIVVSELSRIFLFLWHLLSLRPVDGVTGSKIFLQSHNRPF